MPKRWVGQTTSSEEQETNRYSTSIEEGDEEVSCSYGDIITSATTTTKSRGENTEKEVVDLGPEIARVSYLKFPPTASPTTSSSFSRYRNSNPHAELQQLVIPRSLFLYTKDAVTTTETGIEENGGGKKKKGKKAKKDVGNGSSSLEEVSSESQAKDMARVMRRSVLLVEFKDRAVWDEGFDASGEAGERVGVLDLGAEEGSLGDRVGEWIQDCLE